VLGAELIVDAFERAGLRRLFVFPGGTIAPILDVALARGFELVCARHEQGAGYAALAGARLGRRAEVVLVTSGPGVTNIVTPVADAYFDSVPLVVLTGQVGTGDMRAARPVRQRGFQEVDTLALMRPITKATLLATETAALPALLAEAFAIATEGRPGPVVVDLPMDVQRGRVDAAPPVPTRVACAPAAPDPARLIEAAEWLARAERPVVLAGQGVLLAGAEGALRALAARGGGIPVAMSLLGLGAVPTASPTAVGLIGHTGTQYANRAVHEADLLLVAGARLDVRQTGTRTDRFVPNGRVVRIDADPAELAHARVESHLAIEGDARLALAGIDAALAGRALPDWRAWRATTAAWLTEFALPCRNGSGPLAPQYVVATANRMTAGTDAVVVSGVGSHQQWVARHFDFDHPRRAWLTSGGHGAMGFDLPAAIGAQLARPGTLVLCFVGDGSLQINIQELQTAVDLGTPVKIVVLDNHRLGIVSQFQRLNWAKDPTTGDKRNPDFAAVARAYGIPARTVVRASEVEPALAWALAEPGPALVHCHVDPAEDVVPMLLAGQTMDRMWPYAEAGGRP
jgi:acetolactate synthase I/II/III large subunit